MKTNIRLHFTTDCTLTEGELRALDALVGYGFKPFLDCFYKHMGKSYLEPYENDLKSLFAKIESLRPDINSINEVRNKIKGT